MGVECLIVTDKDNILDPTIGDSCKIYNMEMTIEEEVIGVTIITEMIAETEEDKTLGEVLVMTEVDGGEKA